MANWIGEHRADGKTDGEISTLFFAHVQTHKKNITKENLAAMKQSALISAQAATGESSKNPQTKESDKQKLREVKLIPFSEVEDKPIDWLLKDMVALGSITVFVGRPGVGKSFLTCWLASRIAFPVPRLFRGESIPQGHAIMVNAEDPESVIKQRLEKHDADTSRILLPKVYARDKTQSGEIVQSETPLTLEMIGSFREMLEQAPDCRAIIIDPVSAFYGEIKENSNTDIRAVLAQLKSLAEEFNVAVILITHTNKGQSTDSSNRTHGSRGLSAAARSVWFVVEDEAGTKTVCCDKNNLSENKNGFTYRFENDAVVIESDTVTTTASAELAKESERLHPPAQRGRPHGSPKTAEAAEMLLEILADGPKPVGKPSEPGTIVDSHKKYQRQILLPQYMPRTKTQSRRMFYRNS